MSQRLLWVVLSLVPSSLLLAVTTYISTDIAAVPLLWIIPLTLYLLIFVLVFARRPLLPHRWMVRLMPLAVIFLAMVFSWGLKWWFLFPVHLAAFFLIAMVCHGELMARRPDTAHLTEAIEFMLAGATAVQVGTGNFINPKTTAEILQGIMIYLEKKGINSITSIVGRVCGK